MNTLYDCLNYLDQHGVRYTHTTHPPAYTAAEVAASEHMPAHRMAKTVVFHDIEGYLMIVVPGDAYVDVEHVRAAIGLPGVYIAEEDDLRLLFPQSELGAMPPLGPSFPLPVYLDREIANQEFIAFNAGTHRDVIHMRIDDFKRLVQPVIGDFCRVGQQLTGSFVS